MRRLNRFKVIRLFHVWCRGTKDIRFSFQWKDYRGAPLNKQVNGKSLGKNDFFDGIESNRLFLFHSLSLFLDRIYEKKNARYRICFIIWYIFLTVIRFRGTNPPRLFSWKIRLFPIEKYDCSTRLEKSLISAKEFSPLVSVYSPIDTFSREGNILTSESLDPTMS